MKETSSKNLLKRRNGIVKTLSKICSSGMRGSVIERYKRCGRPNCKCVNGRGHGPKYYISTSRKKKYPHMLYVPQNQKENVELSIKKYRNAQAMLEEISEINRELFRRRELF